MQRHRILQETENGRIRRTTQKSICQRTKLYARYDVFKPSAKTRNETQTQRKQQKKGGGEELCAHKQQRQHTMNALCQYHLLRTDTSPTDAEKKNQETILLPVAAAVTILLQHGNSFDISSTHRAGVRLFFGSGGSFTAFL